MQTYIFGLKQIVFSEFKGDKAKTNFNTSLWKIWRIFRKSWGGVYIWLGQFSNRQSINL